jgi:hypothetical protein
MDQAQVQTPAKESPEGWRAWPIWLRVMLIVMVFLLIAGIISVLSSIPRQSRNIQIVAAPTMDFIAYVIPYRVTGRIFVPSGEGMGQAERICIGIDRLAFGDLPADTTDYITLASQTVGITLNDVPVPAEDVAFAYDPTIISIVDAAGQTIGEGHGTLGVCFRTGEYPAGDYVGALTILRPDNSTRFYEWAFTIG